MEEESEVVGASVAVLNPVNNLLVDSDIDGGSVVERSKSRDRAALSELVVASVLVRKPTNVRDIDSEIVGASVVVRAGVVVGKKSTIAYTAVTRSTLALF